MPVDISTHNGQYLKLLTQDSAKYAGVLKAPVICDLMSKDVVQLKGTLVLNQSLSNERGSIKTAGKRSKVRQEGARTARHYLLRIVIHGAKEVRGMVAQILSEGGLFLQHPSLGECGRDTDYSNPHYLLRPGARMPALQELSYDLDADEATEPNGSGDVALARLARVFDTIDGYGDETASSIVPSPRLRPILME